MMRLSCVFLCCAALVGCHAAGATTVPLPAEGGAVAMNRVVVPNVTGDEAILGLPQGSLASEAELRHFDRDAACFDMILRTWPGANPTWEVSLSSDARDLGTRRFKTRRCGGGACRRFDFPIQERPTDSWRTVRASGGRVCFEDRSARLDRARSLHLRARQGAYSIWFTWVFDDRQTL